MSVSTTNNNPLNNNLGQLPDYQEYGSRENIQSNFKEYGTGSAVAPGSQTGLTQSTGPTPIPQASVAQN